MKHKIYIALKKSHVAIKEFVKDTLIDSNFSSKEFRQSIRKWNADKGDETLRLNYPLNESSVVLDLGGYKGQWASDIYSMYRCRILIFEPYLPFAEAIKNRFKYNNDISVFKFGLSDVNEHIPFTNSEDGSSAFIASKATEKIELRSVADFLEQEKIVKADLVKMNIEGGEYALLEAMIQNDLLKRFENLQIQFHGFVENAEERMLNIQQHLSETHELTYQYRLVWENWKLKK